MKRFFRVCLTALLAAVSVTACAAAIETSFSDVAADAWCAEAVAYVRDNGLMNGTSAAAFSPNSTTSRGQIAAILYRASGSPAVSGDTAFADVPGTAYYAAASRWASANGIVSGYSNGNFGPDDPITRQQLAAILWRYAGSPAADPGQDFADEASIASYAAAAVDWARANGIISGRDGNRFDPSGSATRAQVAVILHRYMELAGESTAPGTPGIPSGSRVLVAYFSATGNTESVAGYIAGELDAGLYEIAPEVPYTSDDLDWTDPGSRVNEEHEAPGFRPAIAGGTEDLSGYDTIFLGYPIWWGEAPNILRTFLENNDLSGKTVVPFCTSSSSGLGSSVETLCAFAPDADWLDGRRFSGRASQSEVREWVLGLDLNS